MNGAGHGLAGVATADVLAADAAAPGRGPVEGLNAVAGAEKRHDGVGFGRLAVAELERVRSRVGVEAEGDPLGVAVPEGDAADARLISLVWRLVWNPSEGGHRLRGLACWVEQAAPASMVDQPIVNDSSEVACQVL